MDIVNMQRISPLWETLPGREVQPAQDSKTNGSAFADIFQSLIDNVRESEDEAAKNEYLLSTGQLDNPAQLSISLYKAEAATQLLVQVREKVLNVYSELSRISM
ncbi:MAG: flagellar hook-basal body complex protein FliE [Oscillospiraceae bacterium]|nr:flagellar hook-basal body complex protein FliE [Oscillospiraceae bacterium]